MINNFFKVTFFDLSSRREGKIAWGLILNLMLTLRLKIQGDMLKELENLNSWSTSFGQFRSFDMSHGGFIAHLGDKVLQAEGCHKSAARLYSMSRPCSELKWIVPPISRGRLENSSVSALFVGIHVLWFCEFYTFPLGPGVKPHFTFAEIIVICLSKLLRKKTGSAFFSTFRWIKFHSFTWEAK